LAPAYYVAIVIVILVWPSRASLVDVLMHLSFLHTLNPHTTLTLDPIFWSLTPEVAFYCLLPIVILMLPRLPHRLALFGAFVLVAFATRLYVAWNIADLQLEDGAFNFWYLYFLPTTHMYLFLAGVLLRMLVEHMEENALQLRSQPLVASALCLISVATLVAFPLLGATQGQILQSPVGMVLDLMVALLFVSVLLGSPLTRAVLSRGPLAFVGKISYSLFLLHGTVILLGSTYILQNIKGWVEQQSEAAALFVFLGYALVILVAALGVAYLSYRFIESPFLSRKPK